MRFNYIKYIKIELNALVMNLESLINIYLLKMYILKRKITL